MLVKSPRQLAMLQLIRGRDSITRAEIAEATGLSVSQVSRVIGDLIAAGLIESEGRTFTQGGRPSDKLGIARSHPVVIGLDVGGTGQRAVLANLRGDVLFSVTSADRLDGPRVSILEKFEALADKLLHGAGVVPDAVLGFGVGLRAIVDPVQGVVTSGPEAPSWSAAWADFEIRDALAARYPGKLLAVRDIMHTLGLSEARYGEDAGGDDFVYVFADSGIAAAIMVGGAPYIGANRLSGEIGHLPFGDPERVCVCGKFGCIETIATTGGILDQLGADRHLQSADIDRVLALEAAGDSTVINALRAGGASLGFGLAALLNMLGPKLIVLGGVLAGSPTYREAAWATAVAQALPQASRGVVLRRSELSADAGAVGAATLILDMLFGMESESPRDPRRTLGLQERARRAMVALAPGGFENDEEEEE